MEKPDPIKIIVTKRTDDYHASIDGHPEIWGCGRTYDEAIGSLIRAHNDAFNVDIKYDQ